MGLNSEEDVPLTSYMRRGSSSLHDLSHSILNARLIVILSDRCLYARALRLFYDVHDHLEKLVNEQIAKGNIDFLPFKGVLCSDGLFRASRIKEDLKFYLGPDWHADSINPAVQQYQEHLSSVAAGSPVLLLAHVYTQNIGITVGGSVIRKLAQRHLQLNPDSGEGVATFGFGMGVDPSELRHTFKRKLDELGRQMIPEIREQMVQERQRAFEYNNGIMRSFHVGYLPFFRGMCSYVPSSIRTSLIIIGAACAAAFVYARIK
mmetsp:Transcript_13921/g.37636  ORF Transcript_13921/g.37636 Transcript_13921/m.37636 type:complete len:262 (+) Transcript_13921:143-928(+)|eukprot:CAMPEP_0202348670 /NCGR_PEP_ID=MMETSP1126-20121109/6487_1 /ASSEMBLY_ACC=CAM_ASM_000457 /TAXON_ID=3047 /ORGANISM="Dunaliella tertiolecta, Strain CCMP1320" /LENGTH=261 /DNA_ID=CAMNT_0048940363 /DNA_START=121 /DNA_END=906 /DNA_ORIENTATION=-